MSTEVIQAEPSISFDPLDAAEATAKDHEQLIGRLDQTIHEDPRAAAAKLAEHPKVEELLTAADKAESSSFLTAMAQVLRGDADQSIAFDTHTQSAIQRDLNRVKGRDHTPRAIERRIRGISVYAGRLATWRTQNAAPAS